MYEIKIYKNPQFGKIRTVIREDKVPLFCLKDICDILGIGNSLDVINSLSDFYVESVYVWIQTGTKKDGTPVMRKTRMNFVTEAGMYLVIFMNRKPNSQELTQWITNEVLTTMRKTDVCFAEDVWEKITSSPGELAKILNKYQAEIDKAK